MPPTVLKPVSACGRLRQLLALGLLLLPAPAQARSPQERVTWSLKAVGQLVQGDLAGAVRSAGRARDAQAIPELDALVGLAALAGDRPQEALEQLSAALARGAIDPAVFYWAGRAAFAAGQLGQAQAHLTRALTVGGDQPALRLADALVRLTRQDRSGAVRSLALAAADGPDLLDLRLYPTPAAGAIGLLALLTRGALDETQLLRVQGHLYWTAGQVTAAQATFARLRRLHADDADALQMLARCAAALGQSGAALELAGRAVQLAPTGQALAARGELLLAVGQSGKAVADLQQAADALPRDGRLLTRLAQACQQAEQLACAGRYFGYAVLRAPTSAEAHLGLALHHQRQGKAAQAKQAFARALALDPSDPRSYEGAAHQARLQGERQVAAGLRAEARRARALRRRLARLTAAAQRVFDRQLALVQSLESPGSCAQACRRALAALFPPARLFARAHLALARGEREEAWQLADRLLPYLAPGKLLHRDPAVLELAGRTASGQRYTLRKTLALLPPWQLQAGANK